MSAELNFTAVLSEMKIENELTLQVLLLHLLGPSCFVSFLWELP